MKFEIYNAGTPFTRTNDWRWRLKTKNNIIVAHGNSYTRKSSMLRAIQMIRREFQINGMFMDIEEVKKEC